jgi:hypothetical protein
MHGNQHDRHAARMVSSCGQEEEIARMNGLRTCISVRATQAASSVLRGSSFEREAPHRERSKPACSTERWDMRVAKDVLGYEPREKWPEGL